MKTSIKYFTTIGLWVILVFAPITILSQDKIYECNFDNLAPTGWTYVAITGSKSWAVGTPNGGRGTNDMVLPKVYVGNADPTTDATPNNTTNKVLGQGLQKSSTTQGKSAYYNSSIEWAKTTKINCSSYTNTRLSFWRWANFEPNYDKASVEISTDNVNWVDLGHPLYPEDNQWVKVEYNISYWADLKSTVYIRWKSESDNLVYYAGWNIDDVLITGDKANFDKTSTISTVTGFTHSGVISSLKSSLLNLDTIFSFTVKDAGSADKKSTFINDIAITKSTINTVADFTKAFDKVYLTGNGISSPIEAQIKADSIVFLLNGTVSVADAKSGNYFVTAYLKTDLSAVAENSIFGLWLDYRHITSSTLGSIINSGVVSNSFRLNVDAVQLRFSNNTQDFVTVNRSVLPELIVVAADANGNVDVDVNKTITLYNDKKIGMTANVVQMVDGTATFPNFTFTESGSNVRLMARVDSNKLISAGIVVNITENNTTTLFKDDFDGVAKGWTTGAITGSNSWKIASPKGGRGYYDYGTIQSFVGNADPTTDRTETNTVNNVYGQGMSAESSIAGVSGHFNNAIEWIKTPAINCSNNANVRLSFSRWANFETNYDKAYIEISSDNINWDTLPHILYPQDINWVDVNIDISKYADNKPAVYIRWKSISDGSVFYAGWNIDNVVISGIISGDYIWKGSLSNDWHTPANWNTNKVPDNTSNVIIKNDATNFPVISKNASALNVSILQGSSLNVNQGVTLTISNNLTAKADHTGTFSLVEYGNVVVNGKTEISRYIQKRAWTYLSTPTDSGSLDVFGKNGYYRNEVLGANEWNLGWVKATGLMNTTVGYNVYAGTDVVASFTGKINSGVKTIPVTYTTGSLSADLQGWNLIGNPYPAIIDWDATQGIDKSAVNNAVYIWDETKKNYVSYTNGISVNGGTRYIAPMQAFFVKAKQAGSYNLTIDDRTKVMSGNTYLKAAVVPEMGLSLTITNRANYSDETIIRFKSTSATSTEIFEKMFSTSTEVPQIYSKSGDDNMVINTLPSVTDYTVVPLYFDVTKDDSLTISFTELSGLNNATSIYLEDVELATFVNIAEVNQYQFYQTAGKEISRFRLHFGMPLTVNATCENQASCIADNGKIEINIIGGVAPYTMLWSTGEMTTAIENLTAGKYTVTVVDAADNLIEKSFEITNLNEANSIEVNTFDENQINIFASPREIVVAFESPSATTQNRVQITDISGKIIYSGIQYDNTQRYPISFSGVYITTVINGNSKISKKFFVE